MFKLPFFNSNGDKQRKAQPYSLRTLDKHPRIRGATVTHSICPYCAVGCATNIYTKGGEVIDIEGNPDSPINEGTLCPKGANIFQLHHNPNRVKQVMWRAPYSDHWEIKSMQWAMDRIAGLIKKTRDEDFKETNEEGRPVNHLTTIGALGGATLDVEENYLIKKLFNGALGMINSTMHDHH